MQVLSYIFTTMKWLGVWRPIDYTSEWKTNLYWIYTSLVILLECISPLSEIVYVVKFVNDVDEIANSAFLFVTIACTFYKGTHILKKRRDIIRFTDSLTNNISRPNGPEEIKIQKDCDRRIKQHAIVYGGLVGSCILSMYVTNYLNNVPQRTLSYNACFPFNHSTGIGYWITYVYQVIAQGISGTMTVAFDTLFCGLMGQACAQLKILQYRLQTMPHTVLTDIKNCKKPSKNNVRDGNDNEASVEEVEKRVLQRCIRHHHDIFNYAKLMNEVFGIVIFVQTFVSTLVLCCSIYKLSRMKAFSYEFTSTGAYMICILTQIFLYCWWGNEVTLESTDVRNGVYAMEWTKLKLGTQKSLVILMARTLKPIEFASASIIVLSLETYKSVVKVSYSMYNLLQQTSEQ